MTLEKWIAEFAAHLGIESRQDEVDATFGAYRVEAYLDTDRRIVVTICQGLATYAQCHAAFGSWLPADAAKWARDVIGA